MKVKNSKRKAKKEKRYDYNDYYGAKYPSERGFNVSLGNDTRMYKYFVKNHNRLAKEVEKNPRKVATELRNNSTWGYGEFNPRFMRKGYIRKVVKGEHKDLKGY